jgi:riboflavin synthase alpha subunit
MRGLFVSVACAFDANITTALTAADSIACNDVCFVVMCVDSTSLQNTVCVTARGVL